MVSGPGRVAVTIEADTACPGCGYNLRGIRLDGRCPECGRAAIDLFASPLRPTDVYFADRMVTAPAALAAGLWLAAIVARGGASALGGTARDFLGLIVLVVLAAPVVRTVVRATRDAGQINDGRVTRPLKWRAAAWKWLMLGAAAAAGLTAAVASHAVVWLALTLGAAALLAAGQHVAGNAAVEALRHFGQRARGAATLSPVLAPAAVVAWVAGGALPYAIPMPLWQQIAAATVAGVAGAVLWAASVLPLRRALAKGAGPVNSL